MELSREIPVKLLCETVGIQRSSFYSWKKHLSDPSDRTRAFVSNILLFQEYHIKYAQLQSEDPDCKSKFQQGEFLQE